MDQLLQISVIVQLTLKEAIRRRFIIVVGIISILFLSINLYCESKVQQANIKNMFDTNTVSAYLVFTMIGFWSTVISALITAGVISEEMETKTYTMILSKAVHRLSYLFAKFIGIFSIVLINALIILGIHTFFRSINGYDISIELWKASLGMMINYVLMIILVLLFSIYLNKIPAIIISSSIIFISIIVDLSIYEKMIVESLEIDVGLPLYVKVIYWIVPQFGTVFYHTSSFITKSKLPSDITIYAFFQMAIWIVIASSILSYLFMKKELD